MDLATVHKLYETLAGDRWGLLYSGSFPDEHTTRLISLAEHVAGESSGSSRKLAFILVEAYQNVIRHRQPLEQALEQGVGRSVFAFRSNAQRHLVAALNPVRPGEAEGLRALLDRIGRNSDLKDLKEMFLRRLQGDSTSTRGGAGLGLIEMARRSNNGLKHELRDTGGLLLFSLATSIGGSPGSNSDPGQLLDIQEAMRSLDLLLFFKGGMPSLVQTELSRMMLSEVQPEATRARVISGAVMAAMEMITAWNDFPDDRMIALARDGAGYILFCGMALHTAAAEKFTAHASTLAALDQRVLERRYREALLETPQVADHARIGLLDLARRGKSPIELEVFPRSNNDLVLVGVRL
jgi:hypothetical protein